MPTSSVPPSAAAARICASCSPALGLPGTRRSTSRPAPRPAHRRTPAISWPACRGPEPGSATIARPTDAPDYSDLTRGRRLGGAPGADIPARDDRQRRVRRQADVEPVARPRAARGRRCRSSPARPDRTCWSACSGIRATCGCAAATRSARRSACGARFRLAPGASSTRRRVTSLPPICRTASRESSTSAVA